MPSRLIEGIGAMTLAALTSFIAIPAWAWGPEGHSIIAEIAQRRLNRDAPAIMSKIQSILGPGVSMASIASWADDYRECHPETEFWHFVDIPIKVDDYDPAKVCEASDEGDCIVAELDRLKRDVRCAKGDQQQQALMFAIHFVGDIHQPLHTVAENEGGLTLDVRVRMHGKCSKNCLPEKDNLHTVWDSTLIKETERSWGSYVKRLEEGWLIKSPDAQKPVIDDPTQWAVEAHKTARKIWAFTPRSRILKDDYYVKVLPILDQQLGLAALRLTRFLTDALSSEDCALP